jgi:hypothetical protein
MFGMSVFYNPKGHLTRRNNYENDKALRNRIYNIQNRENKFLNKKNFPFFLPRNNSLKIFFRRQLSFEQKQQFNIHEKIIKNLRLKKPIPYGLNNDNQSFTNLLLKNRNKIRILKGNLIRKDNELLGERIEKIRKSNSHSNFILPKINK